MKDFVPNGSGNSRYLKSSISADITFAQFIAMLRAGTFPVDFNGVNSAGYSQLGTPLNKANLLTDANITALSAALGFTPSSDPKISEIWTALAGAVFNVAHGGTGASTAAQALSNLGGFPAITISNGSYDFNSLPSRLPLLTQISNNSSVTVTNGPSGLSSGAVLETQGAHSLWLQQIVLDQNGVVWFRVSADNNGSRGWGAWQKVYTDACIIPITNGGTGASTAAGACANIGAARVAIGSYTGTGTSGSTNPNSLTFNFIPKLLFIATDYSGFDLYIPNNCAIFINPSKSYRINGSNAGTVTWGTTVQWYASSAGDQLNSTTYDYAAIG